MQGMWKDKLDAMKKKKEAKIEADFDKVLNEKVDEVAKGLEK